MAKITWTDEALKWMKEIYDYITLDNPNSAQKVVNGIYNKAQILEQFPDIGSIYRREKKGTIRVINYGHYRIAYLVKSNNNDVEILGVFHGSIDIERYFK